MDADRLNGLALLSLHLDKVPDKLSYQQIYRSTL